MPAFSRNIDSLPPVTGFVRDGSCVQPASPSHGIQCSCRAL
nr:hypothetical protein [Fodinicola feengrottensis]